MATFAKYLSFCFPYLCLSLGLTAIPAHADSQEKANQKFLEVIKREYDPQESEQTDDTFYRLNKYFEKGQGASWHSKGTIPDVDAKDENGKTALQIILEKLADAENQRNFDREDHYRRIANLLIDHGAKNPWENQDPEKNVLAKNDINPLLSLFDEIVKFKTTSPGACDLNPSEDLQLPEVPPGILIEHWDPNNEECTHWLKAIQMYCGRYARNTAQELLDTTEFITTSSLLQHLSKATHEALKKIPPKEPIVVIVDHLKSSEWLTNALFKNYYNRKQFPDLLNRLQIVEHQKVGKLLKTYPNKYHYFFRYDDAIYSGNQMHDYAKELKTIKSKSKKHFYIFVKKSTNTGKKWILTNENKQFKIRIYSDPMPTIKEQNPQLAKKLKEMYGDSYNKKTMPNVFFSHKVPDDLSGIEPFLRYGNVQFFQDVGALGCTGEIMEFECIPWIKPPYSKYVGYDNKAGECRDNNITPKCIKFHQARKAFLEGKCRGLIPRF